MKKARLNVQQALFVQYYLQLKNATQATIKAGYKTKFPNKVGYKLLNNPKIQTHIDHTKQLVATETLVDFSWVITKLRNIAEDSNNSPQDRIKSLEVINKMMGFNAPEKTEVRQSTVLEDLREAREKYLVTYDQAPVAIELAPASPVTQEHELEQAEISENTELNQLDDSVKESVDE